MKRLLIYITCKKILCPTCSHRLAYASYPEHAQILNLETKTALYRKPGNRTELIPNAQAGFIL